MSVLTAYKGKDPFSQFMRFTLTVGFAVAVLAFILYDYWLRRHFESDSEALVAPANGNLILLGLIFHLVCNVICIATHCIY